MLKYYEIWWDPTGLDNNKTGKEISNYWVCQFDDEDCDDDDDDDGDDDKTAKRILNGEHGTESAHLLGVSGRLSSRHSP